MIHPPAPNTAERARIGKAAGIVGILCNLILAGVKIFIGLTSGSASITADGFNNLSDMSGSVITFLAFKLAERPADQKHPFGHARFEYLASLMISVLILFIGFELSWTSLGKILRPSPTVFSSISLRILLFSILAKLAMMFFQQYMGRKIQSGTLKAAAADSRNDIAATSLVCVAALVERYTGIQIDGFAGLTVSLLILYSGGTLARETISQLLGENADPAFQSELRNHIQSFPMVIGCHDLLVHDYGPGQIYASAHVEMDHRVDALLCHEMIDNIEREFLKQRGIHLTIHYDPVQVDDPETIRLKRMITSILKAKDDRLEIHDFRILTRSIPCEIAFDIILPRDMQGEKDSLKSLVSEMLQQIENRPFLLNITFDL